MPKNEKRLQCGDVFRKPTLIKFYIDFILYQIDDTKIIIFLISTTIWIKNLFAFCFNNS